MIKNLLPDYRFSKVTEISQDFFIGAKLIIFDVDNTLFFSETIKIEKEIIDWFLLIHQKYNCVCLSNSYTRIERKEKISELLGCEVFLSRRKKPSRKLFEEIRKKFKLNDNDKIFVVGDRVLTDILFGNRIGAITVLVKPLSRKAEIFIIKIIRIFEDLLLSIIKK
jgi:HAD superfamily phosphatase (TIGR01668 family)